MARYRGGVRFALDASFPVRVKALRDQGLLQHEIAIEVGATQGTVSKFLRAQGMGGRLIRAQKSPWAADWKKRKHKAG